MLLRRFASQMEAEDLAVICSLKDDRKLVVITRRSAFNGGHEESALMVKGAEDEVLLAVAITAKFKYDFVGGGVFSVSPSGKGGDDLFFQTESLHQMWATVTILEETLETAKMDNVTRTDGYEEWLSQYFPAGFVHSSEYIWECRENTKDTFGMPRTSTPPGQPNPQSIIASGYTKPDLDTLKEEIAGFIRSAPDPDDISDNDVLDHLKRRFGPSILGKYGFSKAEIQKWTYRFYGQLEKPSHIDEKLFLGSEFNAANKDELKALGITHILNVTSEVDKFYPKEFEYHQVHVLDVPSVSLLPYFGRALSFIESGLAHGGVFVHCQRGVSRSASFVIAHMMRTKNWELAEALKHVKERRKIVKPNTGFIAQLKELETSFKSGTFVMDRAFSRVNVSALREHHEVKLSSPKESTRISSSSRAASKQAKVQTDPSANPLMELVPGVVVVPTKKFTVISIV